MKHHKNQKGVSIIAAIFIIVILAFMGVMFVSLIGTGSFTSVNDMQSAQALFVTEGGLEYALRNGTYCTYSYTDVALGPVGTFTVTPQEIIATLNGILDNVTDPIDVPLVGPSPSFAVPGAVKIDSEYLHCARQTGNTLRECTRAWAGSTITAHPAGTTVTQCAVTSTGTVGNARRTAQASVQQSGISRFAEPFPAGSVPPDAVPGNQCSVTPALAWCFQYANTQGTSQYHVDTAPASPGGSLEAQSNNTPGARLAGYRQAILPATLSAGTQVIASLWYKKQRGHSKAQRIDMVLLLVATDGTTYQLWSNTQISNIAWTQQSAPLFTVPAGKTIDRIRLSFDIQNRASGGGSDRPSYVWFDEVRLDEPGGTLALSWREVIN